MTVNEIMAELKEYGSEKTKKIFMKHGAKEPFFGVKVGDLKKIVKKVKKNHDLSLALYDTGNGDAMYLAGLIADEKKISKKDLNNWVEKAEWQMISEYTVAWIASESDHGMALALDWIDSEKEHVAACGWSTLSSLMSIKKDEDLDLDKFRGLLDRVKKTIHDQPNRVKYTMNGFVIAAGSFVAELTEQAKKTAEAIGKVNVDMNGTACKVPPAGQYIQKVADMGRVGKKKKMARC
ncbi:MAG: DNA alkylation repair protein [Bacteroidota bacterium]